MANEYYARVDYIYEGGDTKFSIPFPYIDKSHIVAIINEDTENPITDLEFLTDSQVQLNTEIMTGAAVSIRRITPLDNRFVDFTDGNILDEESQDLSALQVFDVVQEIKDSNDWLLSRMEEFTTLKSLIDKALATIQEAADNVQLAIDNNAETRTLIDDIASTFEDLKNQVNDGVKAKISRNLFEIAVFDKTLTGDEAAGLAPQNSKVSFNDYPSAYETLLNEFTAGEKKVYLSEDRLVYYKSFTGSTSGEFYLPSDKNLEVGETVYSDAQCTSRLGTVNALSTVEADKYTGSINEEFYTAKDTELDVNVPVYSDSILTEELGTIEHIKTVTAAEYKASKTGTFYVSADLNLRVGRVVYSDAGLLSNLGTITKFETVSSDRYHITGLEDATEFYVPANTVLAVGTKVYKDAGCTEELGTITGKGTVSTDNVYCYSRSNELTFSNSYSRYVPNPFYTKEKITASSIAAYKDVGCTSSFGSVSSPNGGMLTVSLPAIGNAIFMSYSLISQSNSSSSNYIKIDENPEQLSYYKQSTVSAEILAIDEGDNETYTLENHVSGKYIQLTGGEYQSYNKIGVITSGTIDIKKSDEDITHETVVSNGIGSAAGVAFEYSEYSNGHKIVSSIYKSKIDDLKQTDKKSEFYIIDIDNTSFILPLLDENKKIYFCVGNTILISSDITGVTKEYLNARLEEYVKADNSVFQEIIKIIASYNETLGTINNSLSEVLGE